MCACSCARDGKVAVPSSSSAVSSSSTAMMPTLRPPAGAHAAEACLPSALSVHACGAVRASVLTSEWRWPMTMWPSSPLSPASSASHQPSISSSLSSRMSSVPNAMSTASEPRTRRAGSWSVKRTYSPVAPVCGGTVETGSRYAASHSFLPNLEWSLIVTSSTAALTPPRGSSKRKPSLGGSALPPPADSWRVRAAALQSGDVELRTVGVRCFVAPTRSVTYGLSEARSALMLFSRRAESTRTYSTGAGKTAGRRSRGGEGGARAGDSAPPGARASGAGVTAWRDGDVGADIAGMCETERMSCDTAERPTESDEKIRSTAPPAPPPGGTAATLAPPARCGDDEVSGAARGGACGAVRAGERAGLRAAGPRIRAPPVRRTLESSWASRIPSERPRTRSTRCTRTPSQRSLVPMRTSSPCSASPPSASASESVSVPGFSSAPSWPTGLSPSASACFTRVRAARVGAGASSIVSAPGMGSRALTSATVSRAFEASAGASMTSSAPSSARASQSRTAMVDVRPVTPTPLACAPPPSMRTSGARLGPSACSRSARLEYAN
mmetsp:Transcript_19109/g.49332  ORF Transcript_19109/g.49332 Transcript_19109/m.49332 type:complete len:555 (+) Transcript_19109:245-1909(+)